MDVKQAIENRYKKDEPEHAPVERSTLTVKEIAVYLGLSVDMIYKLVRQKRIPSIPIGARVLFKKDTIDRWLSQLEQESYNA